jgi:hypothetical protein
MSILPSLPPPPQLHSAHPVWCDLAWCTVGVEAGPLAAHRSAPRTWRAGGHGVSVVLLAPVGRPADTVVATVFAGDRTVGGLAVDKRAAWELVDLLTELLEA